MMWNDSKLIGKLLKMVQPLRFIMLLTILSGSAGFLCGIFIPILGVIGFLNIDQGSSFILPLLSLGVLRGALRYVEQLNGHFIAFKVLALIRDRLFTVLRRLSPGKLEGKDKGDLIALLTSDIELLEVFFAHTIAPVVIAVIVSLIMVVFVAGYSPVSAGILLCGYLFVSVGIPSLMAKKGEKEGQVFRRKMGEMTSYLLENIRGIRELIQFDAGMQRQKVMDHKTVELERINEQMKILEGKTRALGDTGIITTGILIFLWGVWQHSIGDMPLSGVLITTTASLSSFGPVIAVGNLATGLSQTLASGNRVINILEEKPQVEEILQGRTGEYGEILCSQVDFSYGADNILQGLNMTLSPGTIVGIQGPSGSGKSTILKLLMRFWEVGSGDITINDQKINQITTSSLRELESYVTQETVLFEASIGDNIRIGRWGATKSEIEEAAKKASLHEFIMALPQRYDTPVSSIGSSLSSGEKQRVGIARAFLHNGPILLLDEPSSNLDSLHEGVILKAVDQERVNKTIVLVSHRSSTLGIADVKWNIKEIQKE